MSASQDAFVNVFVEQRVTDGRIRETFPTGNRYVPLWYYYEWVTIDKKHRSPRDGLPIYTITITELGLDMLTMAEL